MPQLLSVADKSLINSKTAKKTHNSPQTHIRRSVEHGTRALMALG